MKKIFPVIFLFLFACSPAQTKATTNPNEIVDITPQILMSPTPTIAATPTLSGNYDEMIATVSALQTQAAYFPRICDGYSPDRYSPNGLWLEEICYSEEDRDLVLTISNKETKALWKLLYHDYIPQLDFSPDGGMAVSHWSKDGRYAYFFSSLGGDGNYCFVKGWDRGMGLFRLNLQTGAVSVILPPNNTYWWYDFSFSPTDKRLVYGEQAKHFHILDMTTGKLTNVEHIKEVYEGGGVVWSSDGLQFVYSTIFNDYNNNKFETSVRLVDARTGKEQIILETLNDCYSVKEWKSDTTLLIESDAEKTLFDFDLKSKTVVNKNHINP